MKKWVDFNVASTACCRQGPMLKANFTHALLSKGPHFYSISSHGLGGPETDIIIF